jgi:uncharacterized membrane protein YkvA (DUF1232 family)
MQFSRIAMLMRLGPQRFVRFVSHLPQFFKLFWRLLKDSRVPISPKLLLVLILAYVFAPLDILPDFLLALGQIDDLLIIYLGLRAFVRLCPKEVVREHVQTIAAGG